MAYPRTFQVLIVCHAFWEGLSRLPALLQKAGCGVHVFGPPGNYVGRSRFISHHHLCSSNADIAIAELQTHLSRADVVYDWIVIGDDPLLYALEKRRSEAWVQALFPSRQGHDGIDFITSKASFIQRCQEQGIRVPAFDICHDHHALTTAAQRLGWPLVVKEAQGYAGLTVSIAKSSADLSNIRCDDGVIAQQFIEGRVGSAAAIYRHGQLIAWFSYYRARTWGDLGPSAAVEFKYFPQLESMLRKLGQLSGFHGMCGIDFIEQQETGDIVLLEQNFRPTLTMDLGRYVDVDFVAAIQCMLARDQDAISSVSDAALLWQQSTTKKPVLPLFPQDVFRALDAGDMKGLFQWCIQPRWWREMNWHEPGLLLFNLRQIAKKCLKS
ncbi:ATP-grasp domain-containing protein [Undibacterium sp. SXout7W]|uniref:ATP-grasp domain-containing protein n=1 Tax=Undibacterium sp. SXout7W TaxID=3413049 RepID=UPI003BF25C1B